MGGKLIGNLAAGVGHVLRWLVLLVGFLLKRGPVIAGVWLIVHGVTMYDVRLGFIVAGVAVLVAFWPRTKEVSK